MPSDRSGRAPLPIGPSGKPLTLEDLPPSDTVRWVIRRKAEFVSAIRGGLLSLEDACERYQLSEEELQSWANSVRGLRSTRLLHRRRQVRRRVQHEEGPESTPGPPCAYHRNVAADGGKDV